MTPGAHPVAVVSWRFWQDRLGGTGAVIGRTIEINRHPFTVIGVAPRDFRGHVVALAPDVWVPLTMYGIMSPGFDDFDQARSRIRWPAARPAAPARMP